MLLFGPPESTLWPARRRWPPGWEPLFQSEHICISYSCLSVYLSAYLSVCFPACLSVSFLPSLPPSPSSLFTSNTWQCNLETRCSFQRLTFSFPSFPGQDSTKGRPLFVPHFERLCQSEYAAVCPFARGTKKAVSNLHLLVSLPFSSSLCMCDFRFEMSVRVHAAPSGNHLHPLQVFPLS